MTQSEPFSFRIKKDDNELLQHVRAIHRQGKLGIYIIELIDRDLKMGDGSFSKLRSNYYRELAKQWENNGEYKKQCDDYKMTKLKEYITDDEFLGYFKGYKHIIETDNDIKKADTWLTGFLPDIMKLTGLMLNIDNIKTIFKIIEGGH